MPIGADYGVRLMKRNIFMLTVFVLAVFFSSCMMKDNSGSCIYVMFDGNVFPLSSTFYV